MNPMMAAKAYAAVQGGAMPVAAQPPAAAAPCAEHLGKTLVELLAPLLPAPARPETVIARVARASRPRSCQRGSSMAMSSAFMSKGPGASPRTPGV